MDFMIPLSFLLLIVFLVLVVLGIVALLAPRKETSGEHRYLPPGSKPTSSDWRNKIFKALVRHPNPYKDIYNPLDRLYWPDDQPNNRAGRRHQSGRKRKR